MGISNFACSKGVSIPTGTFLIKHSTDQHNGGNAKPVMLCVTWHCQYPLGSMWMLVMSAFSSGIRWLGCEAEHSPTFNSKFKNAWSYTFNPPMP